MVDNRRKGCRFSYLDKAIFQPSKIKSDRNFKIIFRRIDEPTASHTLASTRPRPTRPRRKLPALPRMRGSASHHDAPNLVGGPAAHQLPYGSNTAPATPPNAQDLSQTERSGVATREHQRAASASVTGPKLSNLNYNNSNNRNQGRNHIFSLKFGFESNR